MGKRWVKKATLTDLTGSGLDWIGENEWLENSRFKIDEDEELMKAFNH